MRAQKRKALYDKESGLPLANDLRFSEHVQLDFIVLGHGFCR